MAWCPRAAPLLLAHVSLLLALVGGAGLATSARLKWDPSTYIAVRELFPVEYRAAAVALCAVSFSLIALGHLAALAGGLSSQTARRAPFLTYAVVMTALICVEVAWVAWTGARMATWLQSEQAQQAADVLEVREHLEPLLVFLARWHPLPGKIKAIIKEAEEDAPRNLYVGAGVVVLVGVLQPLAVLLALLSARTRTRTLVRTPPSVDSISYASTDNEKAPLKTAFKNGRLVIV